MPHRGRSRTQQPCRCPSCDYEFVIEEGQQCNEFDCPNCGHRLSGQVGISAHPHGAHDCYCPSCGYTETVEANMKCKSLSCPQCGDRMRATETGEYR